MAKVYTEKEAAEILQRAVALQESTQDGDAAAPYTPGISEDELRRIAVESGLDPKFLQMAIEAGPAVTPDRSTYLDWAREYERIVEGTFPVDKFDLLLDTVGHSNGRSMGLRQVGHSIEGQFAKGFGFGRLRITTRHGRTRLFVRSTSFLPFMCFLYPGLLVGAILGVVLLATGSPLAGLLTLIGAPLLGFLGMRLTQKKSHADVKRVVDELTEIICQEAVRLPEQQLTNELEEPRLQKVVE